MKHNLVDRYLLLIHPLVLGEGRRLFPAGSAFAALWLVAAKPTSTGVVVATYQPADPLAQNAATDALGQCCGRSICANATVL